MTKIISKSRFVSGIQCSKKLYFDIHRKDLKPIISEQHFVLEIESVLAGIEPGSSQTGVHCTAHFITKLLPVKVILIDYIRLKILIFKYPPVRQCLFFIHFSDIQ